MSAVLQLDDRPALVCVDPAEMDRVFPRVRHFLEEARISSGMAFHERAALADLKSADVLLWLICRKLDIVGAVTTRLIKGDEDLICQIIGLAGDGMRDWIDLIDVIERYARLEGCARMRLEGRNGWKRLLPTYRQAGVILEKRL